MFDLVIRGATLYDGSGGPPRQADLAVAGDYIAAIGDLGGAESRRELAAEGLALAPGFIDVHTHDDRAVLDGDMAPKISQGVTSVVVGNCGISLAPLTLPGTPPPPLDLLGDQADYRFAAMADYLTALDRAGGATNTTALVGHSTLRVGAMDDVDRPATTAEIASMRERLKVSLAAGAIGFSTGLFYAPSAKAPTEEIMALAEELAPAGGIHTTHMRDENDRVTQALDEAFAIGRHAQVPVVISHFKVSGQPNWGRSVETLAQWQQAAGKQPLALDAYPYAASSTVLKVDYAAEAPRVLVTWSKPHPEQSGRDLDEIAREWGLGRTATAQRLQPAGAVYFSMDEGDVQRILAFPETMIGSDGLPHDQHPHPRLWGAFPRVLGHYARDLGLFRLEEAVRRMTSLSAQRFGLVDRGLLAEGAFADLVLFDPATIIDSATFADPKRPAAGIREVFVNGESVWAGGKPTGARPGRVLRLGQGARPA